MTFCGLVEYYELKLEGRLNSDPNSARSGHKKEIAYFRVGCHKQDDLSLA